MILHVLAFIGLCHVFTYAMIGVGMLGFWIYDRRAPVMPAKLPKAEVRR